MEDLPDDVQKKFIQMKQDVHSSNNPDVLKNALSFFKSSIPVHLLVEGDIVPRLIDILAGNGMTSSSLKTVEQKTGKGYFDRKNVEILSRFDLSSKVLDLLYDMVLDGEYAAVAIQAADKNLTTIQRYLVEEVDTYLSQKSE